VTINSAQISIFPSIRLTFSHVFFVLFKNWKINYYFMQVEKHPKLILKAWKS